MSAEIEAAAKRIQAEFSNIGVDARPRKDESGGSFGAMLEGMLESTNDAQQGAEKALQKLVVGETDDLNGVMLAMARADTSFRMMLEVRNKLMDAYQEVMRMQV